MSEINSFSAFFADFSRAVGYELQISVLQNPCLALIMDVTFDPDIMDVDCLECKKEICDMRRTKIICTIGPATDAPGVLEAVAREGMNVARLNFSHGDYEQHAAHIRAIREVEKKLGQPIAILLDTKGPEIRTGDFEGGSIELTAGQTFTLTHREITGTKEISYITYDKLYEDVRPGSRILIDDGLIELSVEKLAGEDVICKVINGGTVSGHKGINVPDVHINLPYMSEKDMNDIKFGIENDIDFIAASFCRSAEDVQKIRFFLEEHGGTDIKIMAKIENREGVDNIDAIIEHADAVMVARGDMGVELPPEEVPVIQKKIIQKASRAGKQVVTATQMLDSMIHNPRPTRAEAADVANAVYDGTSAVMLSGETASGAYPVEAVRMMACICERTEQDINYKLRFFTTKRNENPNITDAICHATVTTSYDVSAKAIVALTTSGKTARMISRYRPDCMIFGGTSSPKTVRQLALSWGVTPLLIEEKDDPFELTSYAIAEAKKRGKLERGDLVVMTCGVPLRQTGSTDMLRVQAVE